MGVASGGGAAGSSRAGGWAATGSGAAGGSAARLGGVAGGSPGIGVSTAASASRVARWRSRTTWTRLMIRALTPDGRVSAMNRDVTVLRDGVAATHQLADRAELRAFLARYFGFDLPDVDRLRVPSIPEWA